MTMEKEKPYACQTTPSATDETPCGCMKNQPESQAKKTLQVVRAPNIYREKRPVRGEVVTVIEVIFSSSGIELTESWSRAVPRGEIHEIMVWNPLEESEDDASAIAFIEITQGGNIVNGDEVRIDGEEVGHLAGFDYNHMPNHMNIVVETNSIEIPLKLGSIIEFVPNPMLPLLDEKCC
jgi:hypothetical protein